MLFIFLKEEANGCQQAYGSSSQGNNEHMRSYLLRWDHILVQYMTAYHGFANT